MVVNQHIKQISNNKYLFDTLVFMSEHDFINEAVSNSGLLTNKTYINKFNSIIDKTNKL